MDDQNLKIVISAQDNASKVLKEMQTNVASSAGSMKESNEKAGTSFGTLVGSIVSAEVAYKALETGFEAVKGFFEESINESLKASATMAQVKNDVENAGLSYEKLAPQIEEVAKANIKLGFSDDETQTSMGKAILATGNFSDALKVNHLAMDLSVKKNMDLSSATTMIQQAMFGNGKVFKSFGIDLDGATTSAEVLNLLQEKIGGSAEALAGTPAGSIRELKAQWEAMQEEVGNRLMPTLVSLFDVFEKNLPEIEKDFTALGKVAAKAVDMLITAGGGLKGVYDVASAGWGAIEGTTIAGLGKLGQGVGYLAGKTNENANAWVSFGTTLLDTAQNKIDKTINGASGLNTALEDMFNTTEKTAESTKKLGKTTAEINFNGIIDKMGKVDTATTKHAEAVKQLSVVYEEMKNKGEIELATLADSFKEKMDSINDSISSTKKSITDLNKSYSESQQSETASVAESIVASETRIADLKKELSKATTTQQFADLHAQIDEEQKNYDSTKDFRLNNVDAIKTAEDRAKMTTLQRTILDYQTRQAAEAADYQIKLSTLNKTLKDQQEQAVKETKLYNEKTTAINKILTDAQVYFKKLSAERLDTTTKEVDAEIKKFQDLASAISQMKSASASALGKVSVPSLPSHDVGGFVNAPIGTAVPIIAHGGEEIIPSQYAGKKGNSGGDINITINNPSVRSYSDIMELRNQIDEALRPLLLNTKIAHS